MRREESLSEAWTTRRRSQECLKRGYSEIELTNPKLQGQQLPNKAPLAEKDLSQPSRQGKESIHSERQSNRSLTVHRIEGKAVRRVLDSSKTPEARVTQFKKECRAGCSCRACQALSFTRRVCIDNMKEILWSGALIVNPNTQKYRMTKAVLTYQSLLAIPINRDILKVKYLIDKDLIVPVIKLTHMEGAEQRVTRLLANRREGVALMVSLTLAFLAINERFWTKNVVGESAEGLVYKRYSINGDWQRIHLRVHKGAVRERRQEGGEEESQLRSPCLWTTFSVVEWQMPHLVVKLWSGIWKVEYGLPISRLAEWMSAFLSLVRLE